MRKISFVLLFALLAAMTVAWSAPAAAAGGADAGTWELGVILGEPTGLSVKHWLSSENAIDFGAAWSFQRDGLFHLHGDYLRHFFDVFEVESGSLPLYAGIGGRIRFEEDDPKDDKSGTRVGLRLVLGLEYLTEAYPMSVFFEIAPIVDLVPETAMNMNGGLGIRYVF